MTAPYAKLVQVLEYVDGPQAVLLSRGTDIKIVAVAIDGEGAGKDFFGAEITGDQWVRYRRGFVDFRYLFMFPKRKRWYFFELKSGDNSNIKLIFTDRKAEFEGKYIPEAGFFSYNHSEQIVDDTVKTLALQKYSTDGVWDFPDFSNFYSKITDLYGFFLALKKYGDPSLAVDLKKKIREAFANQSLRGGSSYVHMYGGFASAQQPGDRLSIGKLKYASAGEVDVRGRYDIFQEMAVSLSELSENYSDVKAKYDMLYNYLAENRLLRDEPGYFDNTSPVAKYILKCSNDMFESMKVQEKDVIYILTEKNALIYGKISLAHFRRLEKYFMFFAEGRVKDPETVRGASES